MLYRSPPGSPERHRFLEDAQASLSETLEQESVVRALGTSVVQRLKDANDLLVIPNIHGDKIVMPHSYRDTDAIPFIAVKYRETVHFDPDLIMPTPIQMERLRGLIKKWTGNDEEGAEAAEIENKLMTTVQGKLPPTISGKLKGKSINGSVFSRAFGIYGDELGLSRSPGNFYLKGRPALGLSYSRSYNVPVVLCHELVHLDQELSTAFVSPNEGERLKEEYSHELEAHYYSAHYISAGLATPNRLKALWRSAEIAQYIGVETIREKFADPDQPFEPNEPMVAALKKAGADWRLH